LYGDYSVGATVKTMVAALEESAQRTRKATFGMYCFWTGEVKLGDTVHRNRWPRRWMLPASNQV
jgi:hypothetical protein